MTETVETAVRGAAAADLAVSLLDARLLLMHVLDCSVEMLIATPDRVLSKEEAARFGQLVKRRACGEPVSQILQHKEFWGLPFRITPDVLTPRPDSETLVEFATSLLRARPPKTILDIGTGSGCLLAALLHEFPDAEGVGCDISPPALKVAEGNFRKLGLADRVTLLQVDLYETIPGSYDLVVSNPPYIAETERETLPVDVRDYEPALALFAGDGYAAYRAISRQLQSLLKVNGTAIFEIGQGQAPVVMAVIEDAFQQGRGLKAIESKDDLAGICRALAVLT